MNTNGILKITVAACLGLATSIALAKHVKSRPPDPDWDHISQVCQRLGYEPICDLNGIPFGYVGHTALDQLTGYATIYGTTGKPIGYVNQKGEPTILRRQVAR